MPGTYTIDEENNLIQVKYSGTITVSEEMAIINTIIADPKFRTGMNSISDLTEAIFSWNLNDIDLFRAYVGTIMNTAGKCKWALVSQGGITAATTKIFMILHEIYAGLIIVKLFSNSGDASEWIDSAAD